jgi:hypothetical protein
VFHHEQINIYMEHVNMVVAYTEAREHCVPGYFALCNSERADCCLVLIETRAHVSVCVCVCIHTCVFVFQWSGYMIYLTKNTHY